MKKREISFQEKDDGLNELQQIMEQLEDLASRAMDTIRSVFPHEVNWAEAYGVTQFGWSANRYDNTLQKLIEQLEQERETGEWDADQEDEE